MLSDCTLRRDVVVQSESTGMLVDNCHIFTVLDRAVATFPPSTSWWIKGDAVDLVEGLCESVRGEWSGDIDLSDGQL